MAWREREGVHVTRINFVAGLGLGFRVCLGRRISVVSAGTERMGLEESCPKGLCS